MLHEAGNHPGPVRRLDVTGVRYIDWETSVQPGGTPIEEDPMSEAVAPTGPRPGEPAPAIEATATGNGVFRLADHLGMWVVVYFYPRANTPG